MDNMLEILEPGALISVMNTSFVVLKTRQLKII